MGILFLVLWNINYSSQLSKLTVGCLFGLLAMGILLLTPVETTTSVNYFFVFIVLLNVAEIFVGPILYSWVSEYAPPQYLATMVALMFLPAALIRMTLQDLEIDYLDSADLGVKIGIGAMAVISVIMLALLSANRANREEIV